MTVCRTSELLAHEPAVIDAISPIDTGNQSNCLPEAFAVSRGVSRRWGERDWLGFILAICRGLVIFIELHFHLVGGAGIWTRLPGHRHRFIMVTVSGKESVSHEDVR